jgi:spore coat protein U-like protein
MHGFRSKHRHWRTGPRAIAPLVAALALLTWSHARALDCFVSVTGVAFGTYDPLVTTATTSTGNVQVRCVHLGGGAVRANYTVDLSQGSSNSYAQRTLRSGTSVLNYNLFNGATYTQIWGNGTGGSVRVAYSLLVNPGNFAVNVMDHPIYGRIPAQQAVDTGMYSDTILVTMTF